MFNVDTLIVVSSARGDYPLDDLLNSINWSCQGSHFVVVVDETASLAQLSGKGRYQILHSSYPKEVDSGFHRASGLTWAIGQGITYRQIIMLSDECLVTAAGLDQFFLEHLQKDELGVIGVRSRKDNLEQWRANQTKMFEWGLPLDDWEDKPPISLSNDVLFITGRLAALLYRRNQLAPKDCHLWKGDFGSYISWAAHLHEFQVISWGFNDQPLPPLYANQCQGQYLTPPHWLKNQFIVYAPVNQVIAYSERDLRELFKQHRGEVAQEVTSLNPIVTGGVRIAQ